MTALDELEGSIIAGKYRIDRLVGRGGFSAVFRGEHLAMNRKIAVKVLDPRNGHQVDGDATWTQRFEREARVISKLSHPSTITVYDYGIEHGLHYIVMELVEGRSLHQELTAYGAMAPARAARVAVEILGSLEEAHHAGILHRDLKPANIMLTHDFKGEERVKVLDFGIAKLLTRSHVRDDNVTEEDRFVGTPRYASPEQLLAQEVTPAADIYGVGALLWECLVGEPMLKSSVWGECVTVHLEGEMLQLPSDINTPAGLKLIVDRAISRHPADRFASCAEMLKAIESWQTSGFKRGDTMRPGSFDAKGTDGLRLPGAARDADISRETTREHELGLEESSVGLARGKQSIDPNVDGDSAEWLGEASNTSPAPEQRPTFPESPRARDKRGAARAPTKLDFSDAELERSATPPLADDQDSASSRRPAPSADRARSAAPIRPMPASRRHSGPDLVPLVIVVVLVGAALAASLWFYLGSRPTDAQTTFGDVDSIESIGGALDELESAQKSVVDTVSSRRKRSSSFSNEGILRVIEASGLERSGQVPLPQTSDDGELKLYTFQASGHVDVYIFESPDAEEIQKYELSIEDDELIAHMDDHKTVKLVPRGRVDDEKLKDAVSKLMKYRTLVTEKQGQGK